MTLLPVIRRERLHFYPDLFRSSNGFQHVNHSHRSMKCFGPRLVGVNLAEGEWRRLGFSTTGYPVSTPVSEYRSTLVQFLPSVIGPTPELFAGRSPEGSRRNWDRRRRSRSPVRRLNTVYEVRETSYRKTTDVKRPDV